MGERPCKSLTIYILNNLLTQSHINRVNTNMTREATQCCLLHRSRNKLTNQNQGLKLKSNGSAYEISCATASIHDSITLQQADI